MPDAMAKLLDLLGVLPEARSFAALGESGRLTAGVALPAPSGVFPRYVEPEAGEGA
jgi:methionyl-tRNA synthetase